MVTLNNSVYIKTTEFYTLKITIVLESYGIKNFLNLNLIGFKLTPCEKDDDHYSKNTFFSRTDQSLTCHIFHSTYNFPFPTALPTGWSGRFAVTERSKTTAQPAGQSP